MSLREQWHAARMQRQQEVLERRQQVAAFREETRSYYSQAWMEAAHQRKAYVAAIKDYVWGTTATPEDGSHISHRGSD